MTMKKRIAILGSTGSIGTQALEVVKAHPDSLEVEVLTAHCNADLLIQQALEYKPNSVVIGAEKLYHKVSEALQPHDIKVYAGEDSISQIVESNEIDIVLAAIVGFAGLKSTLKAIEAKKTIALANKETMVVAGQLVTKLAQENAVNILPVDSEHSAIFQCLVGEFHNPVEKIYLTASGGPFRGKDREFLAKVTKQDALKHPNWEMGKKITIDSATLINKGLEVIEAKWLFALKPEQIDIIIHPQSIIHSLVQFQDGSMKAQMGLPDMKLPIQYAFTYPYRFKTDYPRFNFMDYPQLSFEKPDTATFAGLNLAFEAMRKNGNMPCILNAANEVAVHAFLQDKIGFLQITDVIEACMQKISFVAEPSLEDYIQTDHETRIISNELINNISN
ncbi:MAG: 1-deoxy-D-xylulose-5-phosphate reductoisomerase [Bacteroidetes bacterium]|nr:1-deoxy-D-xylulose-5-phosphate reductoisomerase [Bacteroidota bacterium]